MLLGLLIVVSCLLGVNLVVVLAYLWQRRPRARTSAGVGLADRDCESLD